MKEMVTEIEELRENIKELEFWNENLTKEQIKIVKRSDKFFDEVFITEISLLSIGYDA